MSNDEQEINYFGSFVTTEESKDSKTSKVEKPLTKPEEYTRKNDLKQEDDFVDDYSIHQNFEEEKNYELKPQSNPFIKKDNETEKLRPINMPLIEKKQEEEVIVESNPIVLNARMKLLLTSFIIIVASLVFATVWNFVSINKINSSLAVKSETVSQLQVSINNLTDEYNELGNIDNLKKLIEEAGYIESNSSNTITISLDDMYKEHIIEEAPSNWFNDVCNFISSMFK